MKIKKPLAKLPKNEEVLGFGVFAPPPVISNKIQDTTTFPVSKRGRMDTYYETNGFRDYSGKSTAIDKFPTPTKFIERFGFKGIEFGGWVTNEDRVNFLVVADESLPGFAKVLGIAEKNIGLRRYVGLAYGARGKSTALAHFESRTGMINLTRYHKINNLAKPLIFEKEGGIQSFAHEWGHALDYLLGGYVEPQKDSFSLSYGRKTSLYKGTTEHPGSWHDYEAIKMEKDSYRSIVRDILAKIIFTKRGKVYTPYITELLNKTLAMPNVGEYWVRNNELFARAFEQYINYKMVAKKLDKGLFAKKNYRPEGRAFNPYMKDEHLKQVVPLFDKLIKKFAADIAKA